MTQTLWPYLLRRLILVIPTLLAIMVLNFVIIHAIPNSPVDQIMSQYAGLNVLDRITGNDSDLQNNTKISDAEVRMLNELRQKFGLDQPLHRQFLSALGSYLRFDFGYSYLFDRPVFDLIVERMPVSLSLGIWSTLLIYLVSIPLGIGQAVKRGSTFDATTTLILTMAYSIPAFLLAIFLLTMLAGGRYLSFFPLAGIVSEDTSGFTFWQRIADYAWHITLPVVSMTIGGFSALAMLTRNTFLEELRRHYVLTALMKGLRFRQTLIRHIFRNAMLLVIAGFPATLISMLFTSSLLIEIVFSLDGLGMLAFEATLNRDYSVIFATLYAFTLMGLILGIISDLTYTLIDPRIDFSAASS